MGVGAVAGGIRARLADVYAEVRTFRFLAGLLRRRQVQVLYLAVGAWNTLFGYGEWAVLQYLLNEHLHYLAILVLAWPLAVLNAYLCYRRFVFRSSGSVRRELPRFSLVYLGTLLAALAALPLLIRLLPFNIYLIQAGYTVVVIIVTYALHRFFSFGPMRSPSEGRDVES